MVLDKVGGMETCAKNLENDDATEEIIYPEDTNVWHNEDDTPQILNTGLLHDKPLLSNQYEVNIPIHSPSEVESYEDIACGTDESGRSV